MTLKILITCPPMLRQIDEFKSIFNDLNMHITTPNVVQTMSEEDLIKLVPKHDGWIIGDDPATLKVFDAGKKGKLRAAVKWGIGVDNVDFDACKRLDIPISNTPGMFGNEVADLGMCYILGLARDAFLIDREIRKGFWPKPPGISLNGKTLGIVGLGDIGKNIAKRANAHSMNIIGWDPYYDSSDEYITLKNDWPTGIGDCDFIVFACALTEETYHMFNQSTLDIIKPGIRIVNIARGPLIKESAIIDGLSSGRITSVALDVFENEPISLNNRLLEFQNCIVGSHNASNTIDAVQRASIKAINMLNNMLLEESL